MRLTDSHQRTIRYLRVSITDRCNYACAYCMPEGGYPASAKDAILTFEEVERVVRIMAGMGVRRVRLTGGEPLVRKGAVGLVARIAALPGIEQVAMTTNGHLLDRLAQPLFDAGLRGLNVSLDTFDPGRFEAITRGGDLARVYTGLQAAQAAGFQGIKINAVAARDVNHDELADIVERCWRHGWLPRFIELMPIGGLDFQSAARRIATAEILSRLGERFELAPVAELCGVPAGPARYWGVQGGPYAGQKVGIISPMSDLGFCSTCNRARLTAQGGLRACLADDAEVSLLQSLRGGATDADIMARIAQAVGAKREAHRMRQAETVPLTVMTGIGG